MPGTELFPIIDRLIPGGLGAYLTAARANGESLRTIGQRLQDEHQLQITYTTIKKWCDQCGATKPGSPDQTAQQESDHTWSHTTRFPQQPGMASEQTDGTAASATTT